MTTSGTTSPWVHGRPIRSRRGRIVLPDIACSQPGAFSVTEFQQGAFVWIEAARHAISSVASFRWSALSLEAVGAPGDLIQRTFRAADDEQRHALTFLALAADLGAPSDLRVETDASELTRHRRRPDNLLETATSALLDGVIGEGFAARRLGLASDRCEHLRSMLRTLANDEHRHAELATDIVLWCVSLRPWIVSELAGSLEGITQSAPTADGVQGFSDEELARVGMCSVGDAQTAWSDTLVDADELVVSARGLAQAATSLSHPDMVTFTVVG
jgi:hypothetical protein